MNQPSNDSTNAASAAAQPPSPEALLAERERAIALLSFLPETRSYTIYCAHTGVAIATMDLVMQAGKLPYLAQWKESLAYHPIFSLAPLPLLAWTRKNWNRVFRTAAEHSTDLEKQQFQIAFVAVLHTLGSIKQEVPVLPSFDICQRHMQNLLELAYWYTYLDSRRFRFPTLRINRQNANSNLNDIGAYFQVCNSVKHDWEKKKESLLEDARLEIAQRVEKAVRGSHVRAVPKKALWNWFLAELSATNSKKYTLPEWEEWKEDSKKLFLGSENTQLQYSVDDVNSIEDVFITECTLGTTISHTFQSELSKIRTTIEEHSKLWTIDWSSNAPKRVQEDGTVIAVVPEHPGEEPKIGSFSSRFDFLKAQAGWKVRKARWEDWNSSHQQPDTSVTNS